IRVGLLGVPMNMNPAVEHRVRFIRCDVAIGFFAVAVGRYVLNGRVIVVMLCALGYKNAVELAFSTFAFQSYPQVVAPQGATKAYAVALEAGATLLGYASGADVLYV